ncbi:phage major tail protein, TP901-1 family [Lysinibacillus fusiformis]|uniref:phage major tail protein, TP901-1 family n=1 Tax=Lysinibacillus fusiformis TaxID=28031 RepID=UPI002D7800A9|nr:phage major tail protein, TP901-1 family [Lysinibacillus fusiformis]WRS97540.1 phage major tail protein, TP901-1 family [Lysinibacillus fusiformis]
MARLNGKDSLLLVQPSDNALGAEGFLIGDQTEHTHSYERELTDEQTKFGRILGPGQLSESLDVTFYGSTDDPGQAAVLEAIKKGTQLKVWEVEKHLNKNGKHDSLFAYTYVESLEKSAPTDGFLEISATLQIMNTSKKGEMNPLPDDVLNFGDYDYENPGEKTGEFNGEENDTVAVTGMAVDPTTLTIAITTMDTILANVVPVNATNKKVTFTSSDEKIARVDSMGVLTGVAEGSATITATTVDGGFTATTAVTVTL